MALTVKRSRYDAGVVGHQKTIPVQVLDENFEPLDIDSFTITAFAKDPTGTQDITPTITKRTQTGDDIGFVDLTFTAAQMATGGASADTTNTWEVDVYIDDEMPRHGRLEFLAEPKETQT